MKKTKLLLIFLLLCVSAFSQTNSIVTEQYLSTHFTPQSGVSPGSNNTIAMDCDQIVARYQVTISGTTTTGHRLPSQNQLTAAVTCPSIGDSYEGGIVVYIYQSGDLGYVSGECHGIIAATADALSYWVHWCPSPAVAIGTGYNYGTGLLNTNLIYSEYGDGDIYAAWACYTLTSGGKTDWALPSSYDLGKVYSAKSHLSGFLQSAYWSSSESGTYPASRAIYVDWVTGSFEEVIKGESLGVRAVRYF